MNLPPKTHTNKKHNHKKAAKKQDKQNNKTIAGEAIAMAGYVGSVDEVAYKLATLVRNCGEHWCYIGSAEYGYIAVGVTYESGMWYCDIAVAAENTDNL